MLLLAKFKSCFLRGFGKEKIKNNGLYLHATFTSHRTLANSLVKPLKKDVD